MNDNNNYSLSQYHLKRTSLNNVMIVHRVGVHYILFIYIIVVQYNIL